MDGVRTQKAASPEDVPEFAQVAQPDSHVKTESVPMMEGDEEEEDKPATLLDVYEALDDLSTPGSTCTGGVASSLPVLPGLTVEGVGLVHVPLTQDFVEKLKSVAHQAPHGRGMETVVDTSVRNTLQVDADKVSFQNPAWHIALTKLAGDAATALGVNADLVRPKLYKLLLYEEGGFFKKHRDTEKEEGMFATLVIQLPSTFTGGSFVVSHNNQSRSFRLDDPATAPYQCHYVAHYADCEHEILPVESGVRLALIYSLCYTGSETTKPSLNDLSEGSLVSVMNRLDKSNSLFAIALDHQYTIASLARLGVGALKGSDRNLARTVSKGASDGWEMVLVKAERTDFESVDPYYGFGQEDDCEKGDPNIIQLFHEDGSDASAHKHWMSQQLNFGSCEKDGMILASEDTCDEMWGDADFTTAELTGNEGATKETTYSTYLLVVFSNHGVFERLCRFNFHGAIDMLMKDPEKHLDYALAYIDKAKPPLSSDNFVKLYELVRSAYTDMDSSYWDSLKNLVLCLEAQRVPNPAVVAILASLVKQNGWTTKTECIGKYLERLPDLGKTANCTTILGLVDTLLAISSATHEDSALDSLLDKALANFEKATETVAPRSSHWYGSSNQQDLRPVDLCQEITLVANKHTWNLVTKLVKPCFARIRKLELEKRSVDHLAEEILAVRNLAPQLPALVTKDLRQAMLDDFIALVKENPWDSSNIDVIVGELLSHGTPSMFQSIEKWASGATADDLSKADSVFQKIDSQRIPSEHSAAKDQCVKLMNTRSRQLVLIAYPKQLGELQRATQGGMPVFSWSIPDEMEGEAAIDAFLRGSQQGPIEVTVGRGIFYAQLLAKRHRFYEITDTEETGQYASVIVKKTGQWYHDKVQEYETNMKKLSDIQAKLREYAAAPSEPPTGQPPAKLSDVDVIVNDIEGLPR